MTIPATSQIILRFTLETKDLDLGVNGGKPFRQSTFCTSRAGCQPARFVSSTGSRKRSNMFIATRVYEMSVKIRSGNYEDIVGVGAGSLVLDSLVVAANCADIPDRECVAPSC